jgi:hypothetical protein
LRVHAIPGDLEQSAEADEWAWWKEPMQSLTATSGLKLRPGRERRTASHDFTHGITGNSAAFAAALWEHRSAVFALPTLIANADKAGVADFLERVLPAIWQELAQAILAAQDRQLSSTNRRACSRGWRTWRSYSTPFHLPCTPILRGPAAAR